jgi:hypothetical protein
VRGFYFGVDFQVVSIYFASTSASNNLHNIVDVEDEEERTDAASLDNTGCKVDLIRDGRSDFCALGSVNREAIDPL